MSSDDPLSSVAEGVIKGLLSWTKEEISNLVFKFKNRDLLFIEDKEAIEVVTEGRKTAEWEVYSRFIRDEKLKVLAQSGLALRRFENDPQKLQKLRTKLVSGFTSKGLHIAEFIQNECLDKFMGANFPKNLTSEELANHIEEILNNIDKYAVFVEQGDIVPKKSKELTTRIYANLPSTFIISSAKSAIPIAKKIKSNLEDNLTDYNFEEYQNSQKYLCFLNRNIK